MQATPAGGLHGQRRESEQQPRRWLCDLEGLVSLPCLTLGCAMIIVPPDHAVIRESIVKHLASKKRDYIDVSYSYVTDFDEIGTWAARSSCRTRTTRARCGLVFIFAVYKGTARHNAGVTCGSRHHCVATALSF